MRRTQGPILALAVAALSCDCGGGEGVGVLWMGERGAPRVLSVSERGEVGVGAEAPALEAPVRALTVRADGAIVALQETGGGAPPAVVLSPTGERLATFEAVDGTGAPLFPPATPPWAVAQARDGRIWVTGRPDPAIYLPGGRLDGLAAPAPGSTTGIAALPDGRMLVAYGTEGAAVYSPDGASIEVLTPALSADPSYQGLDAVAARPDGTVVVALLHHGATLEGVLVEAAVEPGRLAARSDPAASARLPALPSSVVFGDGFVLAGPSLGPAAPAGCIEIVSADLGARHGCLVPGSHRGVTRLR